MSFLAALLNQDVDLDKSLVICFIFCDLEQIPSYVTESGLNARSWLHQTHFANFTSCLSFWPAIQVAGGRLHICRYRSVQKYQKQNYFVGTSFLRSKALVKITWAYSMMLVWAYQAHLKK